MSISPVMYSSNKDEWLTPQHVLDRVREVGHIALDPCASTACPSWVGARWYFCWDDDGRRKCWSHEADDGEVIFCNPPYSDVKTWAAKAREEGQTADVILLVPARTDTVWFQHCWQADAVCFWRGRLKFEGGKYSAPFPSAVVYWGRNIDGFWAAFKDAGQVVVL